MSKDKCPFCGAAKLKEPQYAMDYECGHIDKPGFRHEVCAMRQIAQLTEKLKAWREYKDAFYSLLPKNNYAWLRLEDLGEI